MGKTLIITEKPSVAREYAAILKVKGQHQGFIENDSYVITWCVGHLIEMSYPDKYDEKYAKWKMEDLPFLPAAYRYAVITNVKDQYETVHTLMHREDIEVILYAGDSGREGEVIIQLIRNFGGVREGMVERRVWIDSCTEEEILRGIREAKPIEAYDNLANAGIMRAIEDYAMGINFSRALSVKYGRLINQEAQTKKYTAIAIGRVMTCVLGMVVRREREIRSFLETAFYRVIGHFQRGDTAFSGEFKAVEGSAYANSPRLYKENGFLKEEDAKSFIDSLSSFTEGRITALSKSTEKKKPPLLFNLAELQAECSKRFKINPEQTLKVAQNLYEKKFTTYPRTDARVLTTAIAKEITKNLSGLKHYQPTSSFVASILEQKLYENLAKTQYTDDKKVTDHYAIIPTGQLGGYPSLTELEKKVYDLIVRRFLSIFYPPALFRKASLTVQVGREYFFTNARVLKEPGFFEIVRPAKETKETSAGESKKNEELPPGEEKDEEEESENNTTDFLRLVESLKKGDSVAVDHFTTKTGKTSPPKRYTSGSMVLAMENAGQLIEDEELRAQIKGAGIGTSATRAGIIEKLVKIRYLDLNSKTQILTPGKIGEMIYEVVAMTLPSMLNAEMTASWEKGLSKVEQGEITAEEYRTVLEKYVRKYIEAIRGTDRSREILHQIRVNVKSTAGKNGRKQKGAKDGNSKNQTSL